MFALVESLLLYFKKKRGNIPRLILIVLVFGFVLFIAYILFIDQKFSSTDVSESQVLLESTNTTSNNKIPERLPIQHDEVKFSQNRSPENTNSHELNGNNGGSLGVHNSDTIGNYTEFHNILIDLLKEKGIDETIGRSLLTKIRDNLRNARTTRTVLMDTIREELGADATEEEIEEVRKAVTEAVGRVAELPKPKR